mmetsp:Transcript_8726/g.25152  ORF Transcript_8726/g.25152 Transcript_8726/m.25152 type:complete len:244 (-) Transcript_8726:13-744(-)
MANSGEGSRTPRSGGLWRGATPCKFLYSLQAALRCRLCNDLLPNLCQQRQSMLPTQQSKVPRLEAATTFCECLLCKVSCSGPVRPVGLGLAHGQQQPALAGARRGRETGLEYVHGHVVLSLAVGPHVLQHAVYQAVGTRGPGGGGGAHRPAGFAPDCGSLVHLPQAQEERPNHTSHASCPVHPPLLTIGNWRRWGHQGFATQRSGRRVGRTRAPSNDAGIFYRYLRNAGLRDLVHAAELSGRT